jgi:hypothetical protein
MRSCSISSGALGRGVEPFVARLPRTPTVARPVLSRCRPLEADLSRPMGQQGAQPRLPRVFCALGTPFFLDTCSRVIPGLGDAAASAMEDVLPFCWFFCA